MTDTFNFFEQYPIKTETTSCGVRYAQHPGVFLASQTFTNLPADLFEALAEIDPEFTEVAHDYESLDFCGPHGEGKRAANTLLQFAGQLCYLALGKRRTPFRSIREYLAKIMTERHGSVLEHASASFVFLGVSRAFTHELVRHRAGCAYSQVSQRYVGPEHVRFVLPFEDLQNKRLTAQFKRDIDDNYGQYMTRIAILREEFPRLPEELERDYRKRVQSAARSVLGNYTEAPIIMTANYRAWLHVFAMRCGKYADVNIRRPMCLALQEMIKISPEVFDHFTFTTLPDGSPAATPRFEGP